MDEILNHHRQNPVVSIAKTVKYSNRPSIIAVFNSQIPVSETGMRLLPTSPNPGPRTFKQAATAAKADQKSSPVTIISSVNNND